MNKKSSTVITVLIILLAVLTTAYFLLKDKLDLPQFDNAPSITRLEGFPTIVYRDDILEKQRRVITNQEELNDFLNYVDSTGLLVLRSDVNFDKQVLLGVSTETHEEVGQKVKIKKAYEDKEKNTLLVIIEETTLGDSCEKELDKNIAVDLVAVSKTKLNITFDRVKKVEECE